MVWLRCEGLCQQGANLQGPGKYIFLSFFLSFKFHSRHLRKSAKWLADPWAKGTETSYTTHCKEDSLYKSSSEKSLNKQLQPKASNNKSRRWSKESKLLHGKIQNVQFSTKYYKAYKETRKYGSDEWIKKTWAGFPGGAVVKNPPANAGGHGFEPWSGKIPRAAEQLSPCATTTEPVL